MFKRFVTCTFAVLMSVGLMWAHDGNEHIMGTVSSINGDHVMIKTQDGKSEMVMLSKATKFFTGTGNTAAKATDMKVGSRVVVDAKMDAKMKMYSALEVKIGVAAPLKTDAKAAAPADHSGHK